MQGWRRATETEDQSSGRVNGIGKRTKGEGLGVNREGKG